MNGDPVVVGVFKDDAHRFSKIACDGITLLAGLGVEGDAHCGVTVQHRYDMRKDPSRTNLRQVHLIHAELLDEVNAKGFDVKGGDLGENICTRHLDLLALPTGSRLHIGDDAVVELTGVRSPCVYIDRFQKGLKAEMLGYTDSGALQRKSGVMSVVARAGVVRAGDRITVRLPPVRPVALKPV
ncbi:MOSC domain-containing protein [soil metagenome]